MVRLFLDDYRNPIDCVSYMHTRVGKRNPEYLDKWVIVRNYDEFIYYISNNKLPDLISFDHDLADGHYHKNLQEGRINYETKDFENNLNKTGYHCAKWLVNYCIENDLQLPEFWVHSMNPVGSENIQLLLTNFININK